MAVAMRQEFEGTSELYDQIVQAGNLREDPPDGLLFHCMAEVDGKVRIFDLWRSEEDMERFFDGRLAEAFQQVAPDAPGPPDREVYPVHNVLGVSA